MNATAIQNELELLARLAAALVKETNESVQQIIQGELHERFGITRDVLAGYGATQRPGRG